MRSLRLLKFNQRGVALPYISVRKSERIFFFRFRRIVLNGKAQRKIKAKYSVASVQF